MDRKACLEYLKKAEEQENREWYYHMARDHFAYVGAYRKCIDEIEHAKKGDVEHTYGPKRNKCKQRFRLPKELHSLVKDIRPFDKGFAICNQLIQIL